MQQQHRRRQTKVSRGKYTFESSNYLANYLCGIVSSIDRWITGRRNSCRNELFNPTLKMWSRRTRQLSFYRYFKYRRRLALFIDKSACSTSRRLANQELVTSDPL